MTVKQYLVVVFNSQHSIVGVLFYCYYQVAAFYYEERRNGVTTCLLSSNRFSSSTRAGKAKQTVPPPRDLATVPVPVAIYQSIYCIYALPIDAEPVRWDAEEVEGGRSG